jgi:hypothetical protein
VTLVCLPLSAAKQSPAALVDSDPPEFAQSLIRNPCGPALVTRDFLFALSPAPFFEELKKKIDNREIDIVDAAEEDDYIVKHAPAREATSVFQRRQSRTVV